jgi:tRNA-dihydrouridine synthase
LIHIFIALTDGNVRCEQDIIDNLRSVNAAGIMIAEQILRDPAVFARAVALQTDHSNAVPEISRYQSVMSLAHEYIDLIQQLDVSFRRDGEAVGHDGARARCSGGGGRLSNWWSNAAVVKNHLLAMFGKQNKLLARSTFRNAVDADAVITFFKRRFADKKSVSADEATEEESDVGALLETLLISQ